MAHGRATSRLLFVLALCCIGLASANASKPAAEAAAAAATSGVSHSYNFCQGCRSLVSFTRTFNSTKHRADYEDIFKNFCEFYYPPSTDYQQGPCPLFVSSLFKMMHNIDPVHHCDQIGACGSTRNVAYPDLSAKSSMTPKQSDVVCKFCEDAVESVQTSLTDPQFIDQIHQQVKQLCDYFKIVDADKECNNLVNKYLNQTLDFIRTMDPHAYCRSIQFCSGPKLVAKKYVSSQRKQQQRFLPTLASFNNFGIETSVLIDGKEQLNQGAPKKQARSTPTCMLCKTFVKEMFHFLRENKTEANIMAGLDSVCQLVFPKGTNQDQCVSMVNAYTKELIQLLIDETDPNMICVLLEQCLFTSTISHKMPAESVNKDSWYNLGSLISELEPATKLKSAQVCFECKMFIKYLRNTVEKPKSVEAIKVWLEKNLCQSIGDNDTRTECTAMIQNYADTFFQAVVGSLNPATACFDLGACHHKGLFGEALHIDTLAPFNDPTQVPSLIVSPKPSSERQQARRLQSGSNKNLARQKKVKGPVCDQCVQIVTQIDEYLSQHPIDKDISVLVDQVCNKMPEGSARAECITLIEAFGSEIAQALANMDSPRQFCQSVMLC